MAQLGGCCFHTGDVPRAIRLLEGAIRLREETPGVSDDRCAQFLCELSGVFGIAGDDQRAVKVLERALPLAPEQSVLRCVILASLGASHRVLGATDKAAELLLESHRIARESFPDDSRTRAIANHELALLRLEMNELVEAERLARAACEQQRHDWARNSWLHSRFLRGLAEIHVEMGKLEEAQRDLDAAEMMVRADIGTNHFSYADVALAHGKLHIRRASWDKARERLSECITLREKLFGAESPTLVEPLELMAVAARAQGWPDEATEHARRADSIRMTSGRKAQEKGEDS